LLIHAEEKQEARKTSLRKVWVPAKSKSCLIFWKKVKPMLGMRMPCEFPILVLRVFITVLIIVPPTPPLSLAGGEGLGEGESNVNILKTTEIQMFYN